VEKSFPILYPATVAKTARNKKNRCLRSAGGGGKRKNIFDRKGLTLLRSIKKFTSPAWYNFNEGLQQLILTIFNKSDSKKSKK